MTRVGGSKDTECSLSLVNFRIWLSLSRLLKSFYVKAHRNLKKIHKIYTINIFRAILCSVFVYLVECKKKNLQILEFLLLSTKNPHKFRIAPFSS